MRYRLDYKLIALDIVNAMTEAIRANPRSWKSLPDCWEDAGDDFIDDEFMDDDLSDSKREKIRTAVEKLIYE